MKYNRDPHDQSCTMIPYDLFTGSIQLSEGPHLNAFKLKDPIARTGGEEVGS